MQSQSSLLALGEARMKLLETITYPSIISQTSKRVLWIIRTDSDINPTLRKSLVDLLVPYPNFLLVGSNRNPEGFRHRSAISGSHQLLRKFHKASQSRILIESRLDVDDGLHCNFVKYMETMAHKALQSQPNSWIIYYTHHHLEWHHTNPYEKAIMKNSPYGCIVGTKQNSCITAGLSFVYGVGVGRHDLPSGGQHTLHRAIPLCNSTCHLSCIQFTTQLQPAALHGRTPTSAGMLNIVTGDNGNRQLISHAKEIEFKDQIWEGIRKMFGVKKVELAMLMHYLKQKIVDIARDKLKGQCIKGHSCKNPARAVCKKYYLERSGRMIYFNIFNI